ncbi:MAG: CsgE family curli-type amyloid fiber assembly protein, partial [Saprospiraceae bacterium]
MKRLLFLNLWIFVFIINGHSENSFFIKESIESTNEASLTDLKKCNENRTSYKQVPCVYNSIKCTSPQIDTTKKKQPNKGLSQQKRQNIVSTEIDGLLLDATFSPGGYDFYIDFSHNWIPPANAMNYKIVVKEYQGRGANMVVAIEVNDKQLV